MPHDHHHHDHHHHDPLHQANRNFLPAAMIVTLLYAAVEAGTGWWAGSLALLSDAGHMVTDALALGLAALAAWVARHPPTARHSFGLQRVEVLAALGNAGFMLAVVLGIAWSAVTRLYNPVPVQGYAVTIVALVGLALNVVVAWLLSRGEASFNNRAALLHVMGDLLGSLAALGAGLVIQFTGWTPIDPLLSLFICVLILFSTLRLARETIHMLLEGVPQEISLPEVGRRMAQTEGVLSVHDLHIWALSSRRIALSAHVVLRDLAEWSRVLPELVGTLRKEFAIEHTTLQPISNEPTLYAISDPEQMAKSA